MGKYPLLSRHFFYVTGNLIIENQTSTNFESYYKQNRNRRDLAVYFDIFLYDLSYFTL